MHANGFKHAENSHDLQCPISSLCAKSGINGTEGFIFFVAFLFI